MQIYYFFVIQTSDTQQNSPTIIATNDDRAI